MSPTLCNSMTGALKSQKGFSIISVLVAAGAMGALSLVLASMLASQAKQLNFLSEKADLLQFQTVARDTFNKFPESCSPNVIGKTVDFGSIRPESVLNIQQLKGKDGVLLAQLGEVPSGFLRKNKVKSIALTGIQGSAGSYVGKFVITLDESTTALALKPAEVEIRLTANGNQITGCSGLGNSEENSNNANRSGASATITGVQVSGAVSGINQTKAPVFFSIKNNDEQANCDFLVNGVSVGGFRVSGRGLASVRGNGTTSAMVPPGSSYSSNCDRGNYSFSAVPLDPAATKETVGATQGFPATKNCQSSGNSCELTCTTTNGGSRYVAGGSVSVSAPIVTTEPDPACSAPTANDSGGYVGY